MSVFWNSPISLPYNNLIIAKLRAKNQIGWGTFSNENNAGVLVQVAPLTAATPTPARGSRTDNTRIEVIWNAMTSL